MNRSWIIAAVLFLLLTGSSVLFAQVNHRPIEDFTSAQLNVITWAAPNSPYLGVLDHGAVNNRRLVTQNCGQPDFGTTFNGDIAEKALPDGRTQVHVVLQGKNAFMRATLNGAPVLGYNFLQVCAGATPLLGNFTMIVDFINDQPLGGPLPDLLSLLYGAVPGEFQSILVNAKAQGPLRLEQGQALLLIVQGLPSANWHAIPGGDYAPAEIVNVKPVGQ